MYILRERIELQYVYSGEVSGIYFYCRKIQIIRTGLYYIVRPAAARVYGFPD